MYKLGITYKLISDMTYHCLETLTFATLDNKKDNITSAYVKNMIATNKYNLFKMHMVAYGGL